MQRSDKDALVAGLRDRFDRMASAVFVNYQGLDVPSVTRLRDKLRVAGVEYKVVKNTLIRRALEGRPWGAALGDKTLGGMTAVAWSYEEPNTAAKVLRDFAKGNEKLRVKAGVVDGVVLDAEGVVNTLATMPGRDEMRARLLGTLQAPLQKLLQTLSAPAQNVLYLLAARKDQQDAGR